MKIKLLYFGRIVDIAGVTGECIDLPPAINTTDKLLKLLSMRGKNWKLAVQDNPKLRLTVNKEMTEAGADLREGDEVGLVVF
jgi:molybdopterin converting factor small subunit